MAGATRIYAKKRFSRHTSPSKETLIRDSSGLTPAEKRLNENEDIKLSVRTYDDKSSALEHDSSDTYSEDSEGYHDDHENFIRVQSRRRISIDILVETSTDYSIGISIDALSQALMRGLNILTKLPRSALVYSSDLSSVRMDSGGHKIRSAHILGSPSTDTNDVSSIDGPSSPRQFPLARQTDHSSVKRA
ncbi:hypothetical protein YC2023_061574 [Brassica napus]